MRMPLNTISPEFLCNYFFVTIATTASIALIRHQPAQIARSEKLPKLVNPTSAARPNRTIKAIFPPFFSAFLVATDTIPPASIRIATNTPAEPDVSPFASSELATPAAHDWNVTMTNKIMDKMPDTNFQVFMNLFLLFLWYYPRALPGGSLSKTS